VLARRKLELAKYVRRLPGFMLGLDAEVVRALEIGARADQDEFGAFVIEQPRILGCKTPAAKFPLQRFWVVRLFALGQSSARGRRRFRVADRNNERTLLRMLSSSCTSPGRFGSSSW
jgi:hypothetical protein